MKTNKKVQKNSVQKSEKETCSKSNCFGSHPEADNVTHTAGRAHGYRSDGNTRSNDSRTRNGNRSHRYRRNTAAGRRSRHRLQRPQPKPTLILPPYNQARTTTARHSMTHHCRNLRKAFGKWAFYKPLRCAHTRQAVMKSYTANAVTVLPCLQEQRP